MRAWIPSGSCAHPRAGYSESAPEQYLSRVYDVQRSFRRQDYETPLNRPPIRPEWSQAKLLDGAAGGDRRTLHGTLPASNTDADANALRDRVGSPEGVLRTGVEGVACDAHPPPAPRINHVGWPGDHRSAAPSRFRHPANRAFGSTGRFAHGTGRPPGGTVGRDRQHPPTTRRCRNLSRRGPEPRFGPGASTHHPDRAGSGRADRSAPGPATVLLNR